MQLNMHTPTYIVTVWLNNIHVSWIALRLGSHLRCNKSYILNSIVTISDLRMDTKAREDAVVFLAIATTGLRDPGFDPEICHITLINQAGRKLFSKHVLPQRDFQADASFFNGFTIELVDGKRHLMRNTKEVKTYSLDKVVSDFLIEISSIRAQVSGRIVLAGYNCQDFDIPMLVSEMSKCDISMEKLSNMNVVCADLYKLVRHNRYTLLPNHHGNLKMTTVYNVLCGAQNPHMHDALEDAEKLRAIYNEIEGLIDNQIFERYVFPFSSVSVGSQAGIRNLESTQQPYCAAVKRLITGSDTSLKELAEKKPRIKE